MREFKSGAFNLVVEETLTFLFAVESDVVAVVEVELLLYLVLSSVFQIVKMLKVMLLLVLLLVAGKINVVVLSLLEIDVVGIGLLRTFGGIR